METSEGSDFLTKTKSSQRHLVTIKPDGGYGWVILFVGFAVSFILDGCMYSFGKWIIFKTFN